MTKDDITDLIARLGELQARLNLVTTSDERSLAFHWTDVQTLTETIRTINSLTSKIENVERALHLAFGVVKHG